MAVRTRIAALLRPAHDPNQIVEHSAQMTLRQVFSQFWPRLRPLRLPMVVTLVLLLVAPIIAVIEVRLFQTLVDDVLAPADFGPLWWIAAAYIGLNVLAAVVDGVEDYLGTWISQKFLTRLRLDLFTHVLAMPAYRLDRRRLGDVLSRMTSDVAAVERFMVGHLTTATGQVCTLAVYLIALFWMQWQLATASLVVIPVFFWAARRFADYTKSVSRERRRRAGSLSSVTEESLANAALVKQFGTQDLAAADYDRQNRAIMAAELTGSRVRAVFLPIVDLLELLGVLIVVGLGVWALSTGRLTLGGLLAFLTLLGRCYGPVRALGSVVPALFSATAGVERVTDLLREETQAEPATAHDLPRGLHSITMTEVSARYPGQDRDAVTRLDLHVAPGERVAVVGHSGAGKTTLTRLIDGTLHPHTGTVLLSGHDVSTLRRTSVREVVTTVAQETLLMDATVAENIAFARPGASRGEIVHAAIRADAHDFITALPDGYETRIGQRGRLLSGGQRQRLSLARGLLHGGDVVILDEPTTGLDPDSARRMLDVLARQRDRTWVILTHDPLVLDHVDRVIELDTPAPRLEAVG